MKTTLDSTAAELTAERASSAPDQLTLCCSPAAANANKPRLCGRAHCLVSWYHNMHLHSLASGICGPPVSGGLLVACRVGQ